VTSPNIATRKPPSNPGGAANLVRNRTFSPWIKLGDIAVGIRDRMNAAHEDECESAAMAVLREKKRRGTTKW
jgi:hypothetical protein